MSKQPHILVVPLPAQGHIMPLMKFSHQLVDHGMKVTFVNIESNHKMMLSSLLLADKVEKEDSMIHLVSIPDGQIIDLETFINYISKPMSVHLEELIKKVNSSNDDKIDFVVTDPCIGGVLEVAEKLGINGASFWPASLGFLSLMFHFPKLVEAGDINENGKEIIKPRKYVLFQSIYLISVAFICFSGTDE
ncbi:Glycosyltransferase [Thalictrum thalictroides]|uniref:Glycosyltransferase n=1 Tax=Thalictrum thalictroides TaxID=46969 RepID=A0A7J6V4F1_THATH|nr:Glycosyltransferase [Thalictrum thalictroides]